jgi:hypothetical protein
MPRGYDSLTPARRHATSPALEIVSAALRPLLQKRRGARVRDLTARARNAAPQRSAHADEGVLEPES